MRDIADYLDCLHAGDESNAVIEALEAVNLMTVHAAKGLEFPIVFVVNLAKGVGPPPSPLRVTDDVDGQPAVVVARYAPDAEQIEKTRDVEETKRLLYVALTRARNRLYLASVLKDGRFNAGTGSLGAVLPTGLVRMFETAGNLRGWKHTFLELWHGRIPLRYSTAAMPTDATCLPAAPVADRQAARSDFPVLQTAHFFLPRDKLYNLIIRCFNNK